VHHGVQCTRVLTSSCYRLNPTPYLQVVNQSVNKQPLPPYRITFPPTEQMETVPGSTVQLTGVRKGEGG